PRLFRSPARARAAARDHGPVHTDTGERRAAPVGDPHREWHAGTGAGRNRAWRERLDEPRRAGLDGVVARAEADRDREAEYGPQHREPKRHTAPPGGERRPALLPRPTCGRDPGCVPSPERE